jgi:hypothetical protein
LAETYQLKLVTWQSLRVSLTKAIVLFNTLHGASRQLKVTLTIALIDLTWLKPEDVQQQFVAPIHEVARGREMVQSEDVHLIAPPIPRVSQEENVCLPPVFYPGWISCVTPCCY